MTLQDKWKIAKWIKRHGSTKRKDMPDWVPCDILYNCDFFHVIYDTDSEGNPVISPEDVFEISDSEMDAFALERRRRTHEFRDWIEPAGVIVASIISIVSLVLSLIAFFSG